MCYLVEYAGGDDSAGDAARCEAGRRRKGLDDNSARGNRVMNQYGTADTDYGRDQYEEELKTDPQTQSKASDVLLTEVVAQMGHAQPMFLFQVLGLHLHEVQLTAQKR